jgi:ferredoxin-like protein FixX
VTVRQNGLVHRYDRLEPHERFQAALEAAAREDDDERQRLVDTCPRKHYRMVDGDYLDRVDASRDLACGVVIAIAPELAQARLLAVVSELTAHTLAVTMACHTLANARHDAEPDTMLADWDAAVAEELPKVKDTAAYHALETVRAERLAEAAAA